MLPANFLQSYFGNIEKKFATLFNSLTVHDLLFFAIIIGVFEARIVNLNYNTAFNDEAIYVVIGRMGLFASDWWSYGAKLWMAGLPYIYPPMSALAYETGGLLASRFLNVIFGVMLVEEVYRFSRLLNIFDSTTNKRAALVAAFLAGFSGLGIYVSKLATYDMPSFLLFMIGINSFIKARQFSNGKYYFLTFISLIGAFLTKIVILIYFPLLFLIGVLMLKDRPRKHLSLAFLYLVVPLIISFLLYGLFYRENLASYISTHKTLGLAENELSIPFLIWKETKFLIFASFPALALFIYKKKYYLASALLALAMAIPFFHLSLNRYATLDKHLYLTVLFLSVIVGYGVSYFLNFKQIKLRLAVFILFFIFTIFYILDGRNNLSELEKSWDNTTSLQNFLKKNVVPGDKILTEEGGVVILALYEEVFPPKNIVTFDWIDYAGSTGDDGYLQAIDDSYFDYIEIDDKFSDETNLKNQIFAKLPTNYYLVYKNESYNVYKKYEQ